MNLQETISKIRKNLLRGDITEICRITGISRTTFDRALKKKNWDTLTTNEEKIINTAIEVIKVRRERMKQAESL